jgi:ferredoxin
MTDNDTRHLRVYRYKRGDGGEHFDEFDVPVGPRTTLLDALHWIQLHRDSSLALRHSCMHASCGTCGVQVDGREELACVCSMQDLGKQVTVEPLANLPILTDLVVDMADFYARFPDGHEIVRSSEVNPDARPPEGIDAFGPLRLPRRLDVAPLRGTGRARRRAAPARGAARRRPRGPARVGRPARGGLGLPRRPRVHQGVPVRGDPR